MKFRIELSTQGRKPEKRCKRDDWCSLHA